MTRRVLVVSAAFLVFVLVYFNGYALGAVPPTYVAAHQKSGSTVPQPHRFEAIVGYHHQCVSGIPCWEYTKGSRTGDAHLPESWYLHVHGQRVKDATFHLYVMNPASAGWRGHVAAACHARCFIDGIGPSSLNRDQPRIPWTVKEWITATAGLVRSVAARGKLVLPNSVGSVPRQGRALVDAAHRGSTEGFNTTDARGLLAMGNMWVQEKGGCLAKWDAYLRWRQRDDHFACYESGHLPWDRSWMP